MYQLTDLTWWKVLGVCLYICLFVVLILNFTLFADKQEEDNAR
jgi:hypothetical protein